MSFWSSFKSYLSREGAGDREKDTKVYKREMRKNEIDELLLSKSCSFIMIR